MSSAFNDAREDPSVGVVILTGAGDQAFCSGGDQRIRGNEGYVGKDGVPRLNVLDLQKQIRSPAQAGRRDGGRLRHRRRPRAARGLRPDHRRGQRPLRPDRPQGGQLRRRVRRELPRAPSSGRRRPGRSGSSAASTTRSRRSRWGWSTRSCPLAELEAETVRWCQEMLQLSPLALRCSSRASTPTWTARRASRSSPATPRSLYYMSDEAQEGRNAYVERRKPDFEKFPRRP